MDHFRSQKGDNSSQLRFRVINDFTVTPGHLPGIKQCQTDGFYSRPAELFVSGVISDNTYEGVETKVRRMREQRAVVANNKHP